MRKNFRLVKSRIITFLIVVAVMMAVFPLEDSHAYTKEYGYQGKEGMIQIPGKGDKEPNAIKLLDFEENEITVEKTPDEDGYFLNIIEPELDGSETMEFAFSMTAGMNHPFNDEGILNFEVNCLAGKNADGSVRNSMVNIYKKTEMYTGNWNEDETKQAQGQLTVNYDSTKTYQNPTNNDRKGRITLCLEADTLESGTYILEFGKNVCGNETSKILGVPVAFEFTVLGTQGLADMIATAEALYSQVSDPANQGTEDGKYNVSAEDIKDLGDAIAKAKAAGTENEIIQASQTLKAGIEKIEKTRVITLTGAITGLEQNASVTVGGTGTLKGIVSITTDHADNLIYKKVKWQAATKNISVDEKSGAWSANSAGTAEIQLVSAFNEKILETIKFTVKDEKDGVTALYIPSDETLENILNNAGKNETELSKLKVITAKNKQLSSSDLTTIHDKGMNSLNELDLTAASFALIESGQKNEKGKDIMVEGIPDNTFANMKKLEIVKLPETLGVIGIGAFKNCTSLKDIYIPAAIKQIKTQSFLACRSLKSLVLYCVSPPEVATTFDDPFAEAGLESIRVLPGCSNIYKKDSYWKKFGGNITEEPYDELSITVSESGSLKKEAEEKLEGMDSKEIDLLKIKTVGNVMLNYQEDIQYLQNHFLNATEIDLSKAKLEDDGEGGSKLKGEIFKDRINLKSIKLPEDSVGIARNSFAGCCNLGQVVIPATVDKIGDGAFYGCDSLYRLIIDRRTPPSYDGSLGGINLKTIIVPPGSESAYRKATGWNTYNIISQVALSLSTRAITLEAPAKSSLTANVTVYNNNNDTVTWESSNTRVAAVSPERGKTTTVTAVKPGTATITAKAANGYVTATCTVTVKAVAAPTARAASAGYNKTKVTWSGISGAAGYEVYRATKSNGSYSKLRTLSASSRSYTDTGRTTGTTYYYKVRAYKTISGTRYLGDYSPVASAKPTLAKVTKVKARRGGSQKIKVTWKRTTGASGYTVYRSLKKNKSYKAVKTIKKAKTVKYTTGKLKKGKRYYFKVRAYRKVKGKKVYGAYSTVASYKAR
ncbi:leucine-rich repeat protein [Anaerovorax odorimutans]|uniref:Leucine-rich repeat protein n=1 Tax=Anaerovorax odorimutans TaxID=109327 RepID=A0ABT1RL16_9FIRM|nr:leucine-rich repeat protein [Anaerovorax odorimutans]MCQ4635651.1 leucine-rich repeat protein [Anaerovorax odorimutans]